MPPSINEMKLCGKKKKNSETEFLQMWATDNPAKHINFTFNEHVAIDGSTCNLIIGSGVCY